MKLPGDVPKQVKVKKLKNLKTLDSKPGCTTETSYGSTECDSSAVFFGIDRKFHYSFRTLRGKPNAFAKMYITMEESTTAEAF